MKKLKFSILFLFAITLFSCSSDDEESDATATVRFEVTVSENRDANVSTSINSNLSNTEMSVQFPYTRTVNNVSITPGTTLGISYSDNTEIPYNSDFSYTVEMKIFINEELVSQGTATVDHLSNGGASRTYTINQ